VKILALDFDGVISDSAPESFAVAMRTYALLRPETPLRDAAQALFRNGLPALTAVRASEAYLPFVRMMPLGNRAEDYAVVLGAIAEGIELADQAAYDVRRRAEAPGFLEDFHEHFYAQRSALAAADPAGWRALMAPYAAFLHILRRRSGDVLLAIATAKDRASVQALLAIYGIDDLFDAERLLDKETGVSKSAHMERLRRHFRVEYSEITFLDDKVNHLEAVAGLGVRCGLAAWGYNGAREERLARQRGYLVCTLAEVERQLFAALP
jgi:phosphoglycolate phosphatase-like HAD superfamily hydrolase